MKDEEVTAAAPLADEIDAAALERAKSLANWACYTIALQRRRLQSGEPEDETFIFRWWADLEFLVVTLRRLRRATASWSCDARLGLAVRR